jgi:adenine/guanine phosphoribosyltransferase-like PRPP-binding protein
MRAPETNEDAESLGLRALVWTLAEPERATRLLDVTGLTPADLRARAGDPAVLSAALGFLESHEPDLIVCADALGVSPAALVAARAELDA